MIDTSQYSGFCLPGFIPEKLGSSQRLVKGIDHVAFAMPRNSAIAAISWYEKIFGMKRFIINKYEFHRNKIK